MALPARPIEDSTFAIVANGHADGPAQALRDFLVARGARRVACVCHPFEQEDGGRRLIAEFAPTRASS